MLKPQKGTTMEKVRGLFDQRDFGGTSCREGTICQRETYLRLLPPNFEVSGSRNSSGVAGFDLWI